jgi:hypothetical protein
VRLAGNRSVNEDLGFTFSGALLSRLPRQRGDAGKQCAAGEGLRHELSPFDWDHCSKHLQR